MTNQYALGYKAGLKEAELEARGYHLACNAADGIASLPVPEVQWRDLTDDEAAACIRKFKDDEDVTTLDLLIADAIADKLKSKNFVQLQGETK